MSQSVSGPPNIPIGVVFLGATAMVNAVGFGIYVSVRDEARPAAATAQAVEPAKPAELLPRALRVAGLAALEDGDYKLALAKFTEAAKLTDNAGDLLELIQISRDLQEREEEKSRKASAAASAAAEVTTASVAVSEPAPEEEDEEVIEEEDKRLGAPKRRTTHRTPKSPKRASRRVEMPPAAPPPVQPAEPEPGILVVTSTPPGLPVEIDGAASGNTPVRVSMKTGTHEVVLAKDGQVLYRNAVFVAAGGIHSLGPDLSDKLAPPPPSAPPPPVAPSKPATIKAAKAAAFGELYVISPNVFGEVFIDGKSYGYPPVVAKQIPVGEVTVEIRVDGKARRTEKAQVQENSRATLRFR